MPNVLMEWIGPGGLLKPTSEAQPAQSSEKVRFLGSSLRRTQTDPSTRASASSFSFAVPLCNDPLVWIEMRLGKERESKKGKKRQWISYLFLFFSVLRGCTELIILPLPLHGNMAIVLPADHQHVGSCRIAHLLLLLQHPEPSLNLLQLGECRLRHNGLEARGCQLVAGIGAGHRHC